MEERKTALKLINWDRDTRENTPVAYDSLTPPPLPLSTSRTLSFNHDSEANSEYPAPLLGRKGIKLNPLDIT